MVSIMALVKRRIPRHEPPSFVGDVAPTYRIKAEAGIPTHRAPILSRFPHRIDFMILASASPRRRELLAVFGVSFSVLPAHIDESWRPGEGPADYVVRMALEKAEAVARRHPGEVILGADTAVVLDERPLGKPADAAEAREMLTRLSGRAHEVMSAVALITPEGLRSHRLNITEVEFSLLPERWIESYVASGDPLDKAGAYGIQNQAGVWIQRISGSYTGVVGLPLFETGELLREAGVV
jgi:septum formation protein